MNNRFLPLLIIPIVVGLLIAQSFMFVVRETESAIVILLGNPKEEISEAGLYFKLPWAETVKIDRRNLEYDLARDMEITDVNQERLTVDAFVRYRIDEPTVFYQSFRSAAGSDAGLKRAGEAAIDRIMQNALRQTLGEVSIEDIVTRLRAELMRRIAERMESEASRFGVEIIDVRIRRADYPGDIAQTVYDQMGSARKEEAELIRSEGQRENTRIQAEANRRKEEILAEANRLALEIQGQADATRNCIFAGAYDGLPVEISRETVATPSLAAEDAPDGGLTGDGVSNGDIDGPDLEAIVDTAAGGPRIICNFSGTSDVRDPNRAEFFAFYRSLLAYEKALRNGDDTTILLSPDSEFFRYFNNLEGRRQ